MATFDWVLDQGKAGDFDTKSNWFNETTGKHGDAVPGATDEINVSGSKIIAVPGGSVTIAALHLFQYLSANSAAETT